MMTTQRQIRQSFWDTYPDLPRRKVKDFTGNGWMYLADTRCAFVDYVDSLVRNGTISKSLAQRVTL